MKQCKDCSIEITDKDKGRCKSCRQVYYNSEKMHPLGLYKGLVRRTKLRNYISIIPKEEFLYWLFNETNYQELRNNWQISGYKKLLAPSIDAIDPTKGYLADNIQVLTWDENNQKGHALDLDKKPKANNTSGYTGVHQNSRTGKYQAGITVKGKSYRSQWTNSIDEAIQYRKDLIEKYRS